MRLSNYLASCMRNYRIRDNPFRANFTYLARWANLAKLIDRYYGNRYTNSPLFGRNHDHVCEHSSTWLPHPFRVNRDHCWFNIHFCIDMASVLQWSGHKLIFKSYWGYHDVAEQSWSTTIRIGRRIVGVWSSGHEWQLISACVVFEDRFADYALLSIFLSCPAPG